MNKKLKILVIILLSFILFSSIAYTISKYAFKYDFPMKLVISIDKRPPEIEIKDINNNKINENDVATEYADISYSDDLSGIATATYKFNPNEKNFTNKEALQLNNNVRFTEEGWYEIELVDRAGNKTIRHICVDWAVARIKQIYYRRLEWAIDDVPTSSGIKTTIYMLRNVSEVNTIPAAKYVILDIDKTTITGSFTIAKNGYLAVEDGTVNNTSSAPTFSNKRNSNSKFWYI